MPIFILPAVTLVDLNLLNEILTRETLRQTIIRSIIFALTSAFLCTVIGLAVAPLLNKIELHSTQGKLLSILFLPFLIGNVTTAFVFKMFLLENDILIKAFDTPSTLFAIILTLQVWQFASLFIYLFWMSNQQIDKNIWIYSEVSGITPYERFRDIILPQNKNLAILLFLLAFIFAFYEDAKLHLIFSASPGTNSELVSHWLFRTFRSDMLISYNHAATKVVSNSFFAVFPIAIISFILAVSVIFISINQISKSRFKASININISGWILPRVLSYILVLVIIIPFIFILFNVPVNFIDNIALLRQPLYLTAMAALMASLVAILLGISLRLVSNSLVGEYNTFSLGLLSVLFLLLLTPPITILISSFEWMNMFLTRDSTTITFFWILGHTLLALPILGSFALLNHFRVTSNELEYLEFSKVSEFEKIKWSFFKRFKIEYLLILIFAYSIIWNEALLNRVFSDHINSFVSALLRHVIGRGADFSVGMSFMIISLTIAIVCVIAWIASLSKLKKNSKETNI